MSRADQVEKLLHRDRCSVYRSAGYEDADGAAQDGEDEVVYTGIPCKVSRRSLGSHKPSETAASVAYETWVFFHPRYRLREGDRLEIAMFDGTRFSMTAGAVFPYELNTQVTAREEVTP